MLTQPSGWTGPQPMFSQTGPRAGAGPGAVPRVPPDRDVRPRPGLLPDRDVEPLDAVLRPAVHDRDVRPEQHVVFQRDLAETAVQAHVDVAADRTRRVREHRAETDPG